MGNAFESWETISKMLGKVMRIMGFFVKFCGHPVILFRSISIIKNVKNSKNSEYNEKVIKELKERFQARDEMFEYNAKQTREKFKYCIGICKDATMKIKTGSAITQFQENKEYVTWFKKLFSVMKSTASCQL